MFSDSEIKFSSRFEEVSSPIFTDINDFQLDSISSNFEKHVDFSRWEQIQKDERKKFLNLPFAKFNSRLKSYIQLNTAIENIFFECIKEINSSSGTFALDIQSLKIELENNFDDESDEIVITIKVPTESPEDIVDQFWNCVSLQVDHVVEQLKITDFDTAQDLHDKLFVIVTDE